MIESVTMSADGFRRQQGSDCMKHAGHWLCHLCAVVVSAAYVHQMKAESEQVGYQVSVQRKGLWEVYAVADVLCPGSDYC